MLTVETRPFGMAIEVDEGDEVPCAMVAAARMASDIQPSGLQLLQPLLASGRVPVAGAGSAPMVAARTRAVVLHCWRVAYRQRCALRALGPFGLIQILRSIQLNIRIRSGATFKEAPSTIGSVHGPNFVISKVRHCLHRT